MGCGLRKIRILKGHNPVDKRPRQTLMRIFVNREQQDQLLEVLWNRSLHLGMMQQPLRACQQSLYCKVIIHHAVHPIVALETCFLFICFELCICDQSLKHIAC